MTDVSRQPPRLDGVPASGKHQPESEPRAVLDFDKGEVRYGETFSTEGIVGTSTGSGAGPSSNASLGADG